MKKQIFPVIFFVMIVLCSCAGAKKATEPAPLPTATQIPAKIYYIDASAGSDSFSGTSESSAWQSIAKINSSSFNPGDSILFKRGQTFSGNLVISSSGASGRHITVAGFGVGAKPIITAGASQAGIKIDNADFITLEGIEVSGGSQGIFVLGSGTGSMIMIKDMDVHDPAQLNCIAIKDRPNVTVTNCRIYNAPEKGISVYDSDITNYSGYPCKNISVISCEIFNNSESGIYLRGHNCFIQGSTIYTNGNITGAHNIYLIGDDHQVFANVLEGSPAGDGIRYEGSRLKLFGNFVKANMSHGISFHNDFPQTMTDNEVYSNLVIQGNSVNYGFKITTSGGEFIGVKFYNNSVHGPGAGNIGAGLFGCANVELKNNIFYSGDDTLYCGYDIAAKGLVSDYNCLYSLKAGGSHIYAGSISSHVNFAQWQSGSYDTHSIEQDPKFTAAPDHAADFILQAASGCIDKGTDTVTYADYNGNTRQGIRDMGALEYPGN